MISLECEIGPNSVKTVVFANFCFANFPCLFYQICKPLFNVTVYQFKFNVKLPPTGPNRALFLEHMVCDNASNIQFEKIKASI